MFGHGGEGMHMKLGKKGQKISPMCDVIQLHIIAIGV